MGEKNIAFTFGKNWEKFSEKSLDETKLNCAFESLNQLDLSRKKVKVSKICQVISTNWL